MGLLGSFAKRIAEKAVDRFGEIVEGVGKITGIGFIEDIGFKIQMNNPFDDLGQIDIENSSVQDSINISAECEKVTKKAAREADEIEEQCIKNIEDKIENYICQLEEIFPKEVIDSFEDYSVEKAFKDEIKNTISEHITQKISIDNEEFVSILKMPVKERK